MARPERNNVDYFPFYCDEGKKMFYIEETYGNDGFSVFVKLLRELAKTDYHYLDLSKKTTLMFLAAKCKVSIETLLSIISDLSDLEKFHAGLWTEYKIIWCQDFIDSIQDAYKKRNNKCITLDSLRTLLNSLGVINSEKQGDNSSVKPQRKEKDIKVKEKINIEFIIFWDLYDKKTGSKTKLEKKWNKLSLKTQELILAYIPKYKLSQPDKKFRKNPETFLNNESWNDEIINSTNEKNRTTSRGGFESDTTRRTIEQVENGFT